MQDHTHAIEEGLELEIQSNVYDFSLSKKEAG